MESSLNVPIILASTSPRRIDLLKQVGIRAHVVPPQAEEKRKPREAPARMVARLAREKAESVMQQALWQYGAALIIAADTIVVAPDGRAVLGKPRDEAEARRMLGLLAGRTHTVLTGYCILAAAREMAPERIARVVTSRVKMRKLDKESISRYVASGEPMDKAGAYAAQGLGNALIERISGSFTNVVGLPMTQLLQDLERKFELPLFGLVAPGSMRARGHAGSKADEAEDSPR